MTTKGEYRVGVSFNPSSSPVVDQIKRRAADLIDAIDALAPDAEGLHRAEVERLKALAMTAIEDAAMWGVKAATKQPVDGGAFATPVAPATRHSPLTDPFREAVKGALIEVYGSVTPDPAEARLKWNANDLLMAQVQRRGFVAVQIEDVQAAWDELRRGL